MKKIALEEHFTTPDFLEFSREKDFKAMNTENVTEFELGLLDLDDLRIEAMNKAGIDISVLSLTAPGAQIKLDANIATRIVHKSNEFLAEKIAKHPTRFRGFAALALQDPVNAVKEFEYCIREYKFLGALINGQTEGHYLDEERFLPLWKKAEELNVPIYLHPGGPLNMPLNYSNHEELAGALWGFTVGVGTHALRILFSGLFDKFPKTKLILGHMGETLPYLLWRLDSRWNIIKHQVNLKKMPSQYLKENVFITTSGMCASGPLKCAIHELGEDRVMFSVDYPYESSDVASRFIEEAPIPESIRKKVCYQNAEKVLNITL